MTELNDVEQIAEDAEALVLRASEVGVNIVILVQKDPQGGVYYHRTVDVRVLTSLLKQVSRDLRSNKAFETNGVGSISYGL
jgi:hypothetical protein